MARLAALLALSWAPAAAACDCGWAGERGQNCGVDDHSYCWGECCRHHGGGSDSCSAGGWTVAYSPQRCRLDDGVRTISCDAKSAWNCGTRLASSGKVGKGTHTMRIKAAPGAGIASTFYLSNNGGLYDKTRTQPWVEFDFEIFGRTAGAESRIWTNMLTGIAVENWEWITVPFDVTANYHTYGFEITDTTLAFTVDGKTYRTEDISHLSDVTHAIQTSAFEQFASVWGRSSHDEPEGIPEFRAGLGLLDDNANQFPVYAGYVMPAERRLTGFLVLP